ncbi:hypothetical protein FPSE_06519 [Fusarium pseudograminearum CS3096]|uniref:Uncharacterized protein n=1 Tax=Fusarium pseudograminearum (strain CS3096) TaxID=1028729 RepID=K3VGP2_FUSPC|nr:hypothetical protein FPSE_06519 [Fusarium pseudograminearum CS3096]EKJ73254.1 hypothetical protein FPSE_06519 [Fusarium pseudograminearum CS3096]
MNSQHNDPAAASSGEMANEHSGLPTASPQPISGSPLTGDPRHHRAPSLGEIHQVIEAEQEGQVNRLLHMIRQQQLELQRLQAANPNNQNQGSAVDDSSAIAERLGHGTPHASSSHVSIPHGTTGDSGSRSNSHRHPRSSFDLARRSRTPSRSGASPRLRSTSIGGNSEDWVLGGRDESAFYQAETQMLTRENQMLRNRIRELEKQLTDGSPVAHEQHSQSRRYSTIAGKEADKPSTE